MDRNGIETCGRMQSINFIRQSVLFNRRHGTLNWLHRICLEVSIPHRRPYTQRWYGHGHRHGHDRMYLFSYFYFSNYIIRQFVVNIFMVWHRLWGQAKDEGYISVTARWWWRWVGIGHKGYAQNAMCCANADKNHRQMVDESDVDLKLNTVQASYTV